MTEPAPGREPAGTSGEGEAPLKGHPAGGGEPRTPPDPEAATYACDLCGAPMLERHCRLVCLQCGYQRDCSDP